MFLAHRGKNFLDELKYSSYTIDSAFDVGAHFGETLLEIRNSFGTAKITCFEPCQQFANRLLADCSEVIESMGSDFRLELVACSSINGTATFVEQGPGSHLAAQDQYSSGSSESNQSFTLVETIRLQDYIKRIGVQSIDLLKIDVEGHELDVLKGVGEDFLTSGFFRFIYLEAGVSTDNRHHTPFMDLVMFLRRHDYEVFGFYEQVNEFLTSQTHLRRTNLGFVHKSSISVLQSNFEA